MPFSAVPSGFRAPVGIPCSCSSPPVTFLITANFLPVNVLFHDPAFFRSGSWNSRRFRNETRSETANSPCFPLVSRPRAPPGGAIAVRKCRRRLPANACSRRIAPTPRMLCSWLGIPVSRTAAGPPLAGMGPLASARGICIVLRAIQSQPLARKDRALSRPPSACRGASAALAALAALGLTACGRYGPLEEAAPRRERCGQAGRRRRARDQRGRAQWPTAETQNSADHEAPNQPFILDPLLK